MRSLIPVYSGYDNTNTQEIKTKVHRENPGEKRKELTGSLANHLRETEFFGFFVATCTLDFKAIRWRFVCCFKAQRQTKYLFIQNVVVGVPN